MTYDEALGWIHSHKRFPGAPTLERMRGLMLRLGDPQEGLRFVHIAGTNGKGSITAMTANILRRAGYRTGRYVSPYVLDFRERMEVDGEMISQEELAELADEVRAAEAVLSGAGLSEFESVTAIAFLWFARRGCEIVCLEVGLGGRFDATNVISPPPVQVIASISYDHTAILGDTLEQIAFEKCGVIKGGVAVSYPKQPPEALAVIMQVCFEKGAVLVQPNATAVERLAPIADGELPAVLAGECFRYGELELHVSLPGEHQIWNALTVVEAVRALRGLGFAIRDEHIVWGIGNTAFPARMEVLSRRPLVVLDGAHNPSGAEALASVLDGLRQSGRRVTVIIGMLADKDWRHSAACIAGSADRLIALAPESPRALAGTELAGYAAAYCPQTLACKSFQQALACTVENLDEESVLVVCGSLYLAAQARPLLLRLSESGGV